VTTSTTRETLRVGTDLVHVIEVQAAIDRFGDRYLSRVYTPQELATCRRGEGWAAERLAARFAAKEAMIKVLRPSEGISHLSIETTLDADGAPMLRLEGSAQRRAIDIGLSESSLSASHDGDYAVAVVAAMVGGER